MSRVLQNPIIQRYINYIGDSRARAALGALFGRFLLSGDMRYVTFAEGESVPASSQAGYSSGCKFILSNAALGQCAEWTNIGTASSCLFVPSGPVLGYGVKYVGGPLDCTNGSTTSTMFTDLVTVSDLLFAGYFESDDNDQVQANVPAGKNYALLTNSADPLVAHDFICAVLRNKCMPDWDIFAAGTHTTVGGAVAEAITVTGAAAGDIAYACYGATNDTDVIRKSVVTANTLTVTMSADPSTAHSIHYVIFRPRGTFKTSHYIAYAGTHTPADAETAAVAITVNGALATDIPIVAWHTSDDTDTILKAVATANTVTATLSADPAVAHALNYMVLRAY